MTQFSVDSDQVWAANASIQATIGRINQEVELSEKRNMRVFIHHGKAG
jgi:hypothetical protein